MKKVLIIEKQFHARELLLKLLKKKQMHISSVEDGMSALDLLSKSSFDLIFSDPKGIQVLTSSKKLPYDVPLVCLGSSEEEGLNTIKATLEKPFEQTQLDQLILALHQPTLGVVAESFAMKEVLKIAKRAAVSKACVFITGETGTGKEIVASYVHAMSKRALNPFIKVNCAALSETLIESEFFGYEKGAFTGAFSKKEGRFELADGGTLLLDEISEIPPILQAKLLRVIQEQEFERVGGVKPIHVDVRLIATSNQDLKEAMQNKTFRKDLYYRLNVIPIFLPPLRERREDILPLARHFLEQFCRENQLPLKRLHLKTQEKLLNYSWPGNIRELRNMIEYFVSMNESDVIEDTCFLVDQERELPKNLSLKELEKLEIIRVLSECAQNRTKAAKKLGISVRTLRNKLKLYREGQ